MNIYKCSLTCFQFTNSLFSCVNLMLTTYTELLILIILFCVLVILVFVVFISTMSSLWLFTEYILSLYVNILKEMYLFYTVISSTDFHGLFYWFSFFFLVLFSYVPPNIPIRPVKNYNLVSQLFLYKKQYPEGK